MPSLVPEDTEVETFPTLPWGPQMENEDQPWHVLPSLRLSRVGGQCRGCKDWGRLISFTETGTGGVGRVGRGFPCPVVALTQSRPTGPEVQGGLNFAVCLMSVPQPPAAQLLALAPTPPAQSNSPLASPSPSCLHIASLVFPRPDHSFNRSYLDSCFVPGLGLSSKTDLVEFPVRRSHTDNYKLRSAMEKT